jgi:threonine/homoserine/homoserine lactone efflux protein
MLRCSISDLLTYTIATFLILAAPGPLNVLLAASGATVGIRSSLYFIIFQLTGYSIALSVLILAGRPLIAAFPPLSLVVRLLLAIYLLAKAAHLWYASVHRDLFVGKRLITGRACFIAAVLNPKAFIFAFAVFPPFKSGWDLIVYPGLFAVNILVTAVCWISIGVVGGAVLEHAGGKAIPRATAITLTLFALGVIGSIIWA